MLGRYGQAIDSSNPDRRCFFPDLSGGAVRGHATPRDERASPERVHRVRENRSPCGALAGARMASRQRHDDRVRQAGNLALSGVVAPPFDTVDINGNSHRLKDHKGKVVLVNVWATWCTPCRHSVHLANFAFRSHRSTTWHGVTFGPRYLTATSCAAAGTSPRATFAK